MENKQNQSVIEHLPEDATLEQVIATVNHINEKLDYYLSDVGIDLIIKKAIKAIEDLMESGASRSGKKNSANPFKRN